MCVHKVVEIVYHLLPMGCFVDIRHKTANDSAVVFSALNSILVLEVYGVEVYGVEG